MVAGSLVLLSGDDVMSSPSFGTQLKDARRRAGFVTLAEFAQALSDDGYPLTEDAIGLWESGKRKPKLREDLFKVLKPICKNRGIRSIDEINRMLYSLDWRNLNDNEHLQYFSGLSASVSDNLPPHPPYHRLVGRDEFMQATLKRLLDANDTPIVAISGLGGIGKTAAAYEIVQHAMAAQRFDQMVWETAKSEEFDGTETRIRRKQTINIQSILAVFARQLKLEHLVSADEQTLIQQLGKIWRTGSYLIVLDNLETLEASQDIARLLYEMISPTNQVNPSKVLLTSRERLIDTHYVYDAYLQGLSESGSFELLRDDAGQRGASAISNASDDFLSRIHKTTGGMPLALKLIVTQSLFGIALDTELERLKQATNEEQIYRFIYFTLWSKLTVDAQKILVGLATFGTSAQRQHLVKVSKSIPSEFDTASSELVRASLLEVISHAEAEQQRYNIHAMTRWFVNAPLTEIWNQQRQQRSANDKN